MWGEVRKILKQFLEVKNWISTNKESLVKEISDTSHEINSDNLSKEQKIIELLKIFQDKIEKNELNPKIVTFLKKEFINSLTDLTKFKQKQTTLAELNEKINNFQSNFQQEKQVLRKWWYWPLKFITCGMWESEAIRQLNDKYNELKQKYTELKVEIESLKTICSLINGKKSQSLNDLNEDNIDSSFTKDFQSSEVNNFNKTSLSKQTLPSISPSTLFLLDIYLRRYL
ncbi:hypothetical protein [Spiroplasma endosymbiont of Virgichneumon dumeticola]|uniref:hypothetical protein n=1 Tax=Spiroplasma endosymbiont of Virgichneumon dumeticola TaxID=3139323 RepID=UPI0035C8BA96